MGLSANSDRLDVLRESSGRGRAHGPNYVGRATGDIGSKQPHLIGGVGQGLEQSSSRPIARMRSRGPV